MNIFWLDMDNRQAAKFYCDKHVTKINVEINQILSTALRDMGYDWGFLYEPTHTGHPIIDWVKQSHCNFDDTLNHAMALGDEFSYRYGGTHKSHDQVAQNLINRNIDFPSYKITQRPQAMPDEYKVEGDHVQAYRNYYREGKDWDMSWSKRPVPYWYNE